jgi:glycosyltransferase involved in cell wall biosynthesis
MHIGIDYTSAVTQGAGIGRYTRELIRALLAVPADHRYTLVYASPQPLQPAANPLRSDLPAAVRLRRIPFHDKWLMRAWHRLRLPIPIELVTGRVDLFHSPDFTLPPTLPGVPTLLTVHDLSFIRDPDSAWPSLRVFLERAVSRSVKRATHVLADSQATRDDLVDIWHTPAEKITVLYSGVEPRFRPIRDRAQLDQIREKYRIEPKPFILAIGTLQPRKNYKRLIEAFALLANEPPFKTLQLIIAGGRGWLFDDIFTHVKQFGLEDRVRFPGFIADEDLPALYSAADLLAYVSLYEGFGLPALEAMACGTPVVGSNVSSVPEVIGSAGLQVDPRDVDAIADALKRMLTQADLRERSIAAGIERAKQFTWEQSAQQLLSIYAQLLKRN